jgi:hypothetical protein
VSEWLAPHGRFLPLGSALAVGLILGLVLTGTADKSGLVASRNGKLVAQGELDETLSLRLASERLAGTDTRVGTSFLANDGRYCRTFTAQGKDGAMAGLACRTGDEWQIAALGATTPSQPDVYQPAASALPSFIRQAMTDMLAGAPLDADGERRARDNGWQRPR